MMNNTLAKIQPIHPTELFNGYVGANVVYTLQQIGFFSLMTSEVTMKPNEISAHLKCDPSRLSALLKVSTALGYTETDEDGNLSLTPMGKIVSGQIGYFAWSVGGYGHFFQALSHLTMHPEMPWKHLRDERMVASGTDMNQRSFLEKRLFQVTDDVSFSTIADFGCGNGGRLVAFSQRYPHIKGIGIDISSEAIKLAKENVNKHHLEHRLQMICADILEALLSSEYQAILSNVEIVSSFMMLHDLYTLPDVWDGFFDRLRNVFPRAKYFLFVDTVKMPSTDLLDRLPIFSLGYELLHTYMNVQLPTREAYDEAFKRAGLTIEKCVDFGAPYTYLYLLRV